MSPILDIHTLYSLLLSISMSPFLIWSFFLVCIFTFLFLSFITVLFSFLLSCSNPANSHILFWATRANQHVVVRGLRYSLQFSVDHGIHTAISYPPPWRYGNATAPLNRGSHNIYLYFIDRDVAGPVASALGFLISLRGKCCWLAACSQH